MHNKICSLQIVIEEQLLDFLYAVDRAD